MKYDTNHPNGIQPWWPHGFQTLVADLENQLASVRRKRMGDVQRWCSSSVAKLIELSWILYTWFMDTYIYIYVDVVDQQT
jgi:hypothetical protein